ncbi:MAG: cation diffusion facilitator family transporter [Oscillospiraceae bacterium]|nr:cation diffusion facilitator family transporter [Oscillospiraceae bacterium]
MTLDNKSKYIRAAAMIALTGNTAMAALKLIFGAASGSGALVGDGIDSAADVLMSIITLAVVKIMARPADKDHPWGHARAETMATTVLSFVIFFAGAQLIFRSLSELFTGARGESPTGAALIIAAVSVAGKLFLAWSQHTLAKRANSSMLHATAKNMLGDVFTSLGVIVGLLLSNWTSSDIPDTILACLVGALIIVTAIKIFRDTNTELMDGSASDEQYKTLFDAVNSVEGAHSPHRTRIRKIGGFLDIDTDIEVDPNITVEEAHKIASQAENAIKERLENVYDIMVHIEPRHHVGDEGYGLSETSIEE